MSKFTIVYFLFALLAQAHYHQHYGIGRAQRDGDTREVNASEAVTDLIVRIVGRYAALFRIETNVTCRPGHAACFTVDVLEEWVLLRGTTGVEVASGFHWFLKAVCNSSVSWDKTGGNHLDTSCLDSEAQKAHRGLHVYRNRSVAWHYYQNVVTASYSSTWWDWRRWENEIDWMALNGVNLPLAFTGQEKIWAKVFGQFNVTEEELESSFTGPSFLAWGRMGNIRGYAGPLSQKWRNRQADLQKQILARMRALGMTPVLPAFAGFIPQALAEKYPQAQVLQLPNWGGFPPEHCCVSLLDPLDPLFHEIGRAFVQEVRMEFGDDPISFYSADNFNEMLPPSGEPSFLRSVSAAVYSAMAAADESATWLMQAWTFFDDQEFWTNPRIEGYISGVPPGRLVLLDLYAEVRPLWNLTNSFSGAPFIWCCLHNFGGNTEMYGDLQAIASYPAQALAANSSITGFGLCMEAIEQNPIVYSLMNEWPWRTAEIDIEAWIVEYVWQRYGRDTNQAALDAWGILRRTVYNATDKHLDHSKDIPTSHPGLHPQEVGLWGLRPELWYNPDQVVVAWRKLVESAQGFRTLPETLLYDIVDVGRQVLSKKSTEYWQEAVQSYNNRDLKGLETASHNLLALLGDLDELLSTHRGFLLGPWLESSKAAAGSQQEAKQFEWNMRAQVTVWGKSSRGPSELEDYASREWGDLVKDYYLARWELWLQRLRADLRQGREYNVSQWRTECLRASEQWIHEQNAYPIEPFGNALTHSERALATYFATGNETMR